MSPLKLAAVGILVVAVDLNVGVVDLLFDPIGYAMVAYGVHQLADRHPGFRWARVAALVGLAASIVSTLLRRMVTDGQAMPGLPDDAPFTTTTSRLEEPLLPGLVETLAQAGFVIAVCTALIALSAEPRVRDAARALRVALPTVDLLAGVFATVVVLSMRLADDPGNVPLAGLASLLGGLLIIVGLVLAIWFFLTLLRAAREPIFQRGWVADMIPG